MLKLVIAAGLGVAIGVLATLSITSQGWLVASIRHNWTWQSGLEWMTAIATAAAFVAAAFNLYWMNLQWREAQKQTRFALGEEEPTLDVVEHQKHKTILVIRMVNWNRRAIFIRDIVVSSKEKPAEMDEQVAIWKAENKKGEIANTLPVQINGWENRSDNPHFAHIDLLLLRRVMGSEQGWESDLAVPFPPDATITLKVQMLGNVHRIFELTAKAFPDG